MITHRELLTAVLAGEPMPISPVAFWQHHPIADQNGTALMAATLAFQQRFDCDLVKITPASSFQLRDYGLKDAWQGDSLGRRTLGAGIIHHPDGLTRLPCLSPYEGFLSHHVFCAQQLRQSLPDHVPIIQSVFNPIFQLAGLLGGRFDGYWASYPQEIAAALATITENTVAFIAALCAIGIDGIYLVSQHAQNSIMPLADYLRRAEPYDQQCLSSAAGLPFNMLHRHGEGVYSYPTACVLHYSLDPLNPTPEMLLAGHTAISTGLAQFGAISRGGVGEVIAETDALLHRLKGPRFILSAGCVLPLDTPEANIHAAISAARSPRLDRLTG